MKYSTIIKLAELGRLSIDFKKIWDTLIIKKGSKEIFRYVNLRILDDKEVLSYLEDDSMTFKLQLTWESYESFIRYAISLRTIQGDLDFKSLHVWDQLRKEILPQRFPDTFYNVVDYESYLIVFLNKEPKESEIKLNGQTVFQSTYNGIHISIMPFNGYFGDVFSQKSRNIMKLIYPEIADQRNLKLILEPKISYTFQEFIYISKKINSVFPTFLDTVF